jgi:DNA-binding NtrC family response regulator
MARILFISHDADMRAVASRVLIKHDHLVAIAEHAGHASLACMDRQDFDVIVIEEQMPEAPGMAIAERLRRYCPGAEIVRMSVAGAGGSSEDQGARLVRPFNADQLLDAISVAAAAAAAKPRQKSAGAVAG